MKCFSFCDSSSPSSKSLRSQALLSSSQQSGVVQEEVTQGRCEDIKGYAPCGEGASQIF